MSLRVKTPEAIAIDWSGARTGSAAHIWIACARDGELLSLHAPGSRESVAAWLHARRRAAAPCVVGLDFAFGMPAWFASERGWQTIDAVWDAAARDGEQWLRECRPPFWGRRGAARPHSRDRGLRETECNAPAHTSPKSVLQIGGAGSVGTGSIRGMPMLRALRDTGWRIWPFDPSGDYTVVEIYPRYFTGPVIKRSADARATLLRERWSTLSSAHHATMSGNEDAFDAGVSALVMSRMLPRHAPDVPREPQSALEGEIWWPARDGPSDAGGAVAG